jgi:hypothetical protein
VKHLKRFSIGLAISACLSAVVSLLWFMMSYPTAGWCIVAIGVMYALGWTYEADKKDRQTREIPRSPNW